MTRLRTLMLIPLAMAVPAGSVAWAAPGAAVPTPKAGTWNLTQSFHETHGGSFTVTAGLKEKALTTKVGSAATQYCGSGTVHVLGKHDIHKVGSGANRTYIVGRRLDSTQSFGVKPIDVTVLFKQKKYAGTLGIKFDGGRTGEGQVNFSPVPGYACDLPFDAHKAAS